MFLPYPLNFQNFSKTPIVWLLFAINFFGFLSMVEDHPAKSDHEFLFESHAVLAIADVYGAEYLHLPATQLSRSQKYALAMQALRDQRFMDRIADLQISTDLVLNAKIQKALKGFKDEQISRKSYLLGLGPLSDWKAYLTYQFTHADFFHLLSNMLFLFGIGFFLEASLGAFGFALLYLMCGVSGAILFNLMNDQSFLPMIGASGSVTGLMIFYALFEKRRNIRYVFFLSPLREHHGFIHAPKWWIFAFFPAKDLAEILATPAGLSTGVAYAAHAGGAIMGIVLALLLNFVFDRSKSASQGVLGHGHGL